MGYLGKNVTGCSVFGGKLMGYSCRIFKTHPRVSGKKIAFEI